MYAHEEIQKKLSEKWDNQQHFGDNLPILGYFGKKNMLK